MSQRPYVEGVGTLGRLAVTLGALVVLGYFIAAVSADTAIHAYNEPGTAGKFEVQFALGFAVVLGWALLAAVEEIWRDRDDDPAESLWHFFSQASARAMAGLVVFFVVVGIEIGFESLGVGLGAG